MWAAWLIALAPVLVRLLVTGRVSRRTPLDVPIVLGVIAVVIGFVHGPDRQLAWSGLNSFLACVLLYYGIVNNAHQRRNYWFFWASFVLIVSLLLTISIFRGGVSRTVVFNLWAYSFAANMHWPFALKGSLNVIGDICAVVLPGLMSAALFRQKAWLRWCAVLFAVLFVFLMFISASGGGWIVVTAALLIVLLRYNVKVFGMTAALVAGAVAVLISFRSTAWERSVFQIASVTGRLNIWKSTIVALKSDPLLGFGLGGWWSSVPANVTVTPRSRSASGTNPGRRGPCRGRRFAC